MGLYRNNAGDRYASVDRNNVINVLERLYEQLDGDAGADGGAAIRNDETEYRAIPGGSDIGHLLFPHIQRLRPEKVQAPVA